MIHPMSTEAHADHVAAEPDETDDQRGRATPATETTEESTGESTPETTGAETPAREIAGSPALEREGEIAADFLESLLDIADLDGDLDVDIEGDRAAVSLVDGEDGPAPTSLVGSDGAVLEALQELTRLAVQAETGERSRLMLDVAGFRARRRAAIVEEAQRLVARARETGEAQEMAPAGAFERKVAHDVVLEAGLHSESEGKEPRRYVVISTAG